MRVRGRLPRLEDGLQFPSRELLADLFERTFPEIVERPILNTRA